MIATRNRAPELARTSSEIHALHPRPAIVVMDNGSTDNTVAAAEAFPDVRVVRLPRNFGAAARNLGVAIVRKEAYLQAAGFSPLLHFGAEERLLSLRHGGLWLAPLLRGACAGAGFGDKNPSVVPPRAAMSVDVHRQPVSQRPATHRCRSAASSIGSSRASGRRCMSTRRGSGRTE
ncbi:glycosyltransferase family 2 protein [Nocardia abscessus]|uniref:glycosyltransferase family 2 protein n=1 Tax=Nocardia abscessus TaxID=120957 RepID=UPI00397F33C7